MANAVRRTRISLLLSFEDILKSLSFQFGSGRNKKYLIMGIMVILWNGMVDEILDLGCVLLFDNV